MLEEAARVRQEYASAFMSSKTPSVEEIEEAQSRHHYQTLNLCITSKKIRMNNNDNINYWLHRMHGTW
jgi:hypothetical protein